MQFILVRAGVTDFDSPARIMGRLDIPLNAAGREQVRGTIDALVDVAICDGRSIDEVCCCPSRAAEETAWMVGETFGTRVRSLPLLMNLDQGLWQGQLVEEIKRRQPRVFRRWLADPETICPPEGETLAEARDRVKRAIERIRRRPRVQRVVVVCPEPLAGIVREVIMGQSMAERHAEGQIEPLWEILSSDPSELFEQEAAAVAQTP